MEWYIPLTILPGIGLFVLSTSNLIVSLNNEIRDLNKQKDTFKIVIDKKINQLKKLNYALILQYISAFTFLIGGVIGEITQENKTIVYIVICGVFLFGLGIILLINYAINSLKIRQEHLKI